MTTVLNEFLICLMLGFLGSIVVMIVPGVGVVTTVMTVILLISVRHLTVMTMVAVGIAMAVIVKAMPQAVTISRRT